MSPSLSVHILVLFIITLSSCDPPSTAQNSNNSNHTNNINNQTPECINQDNKHIHWLETNLKIHNGVDYPEICMSKNQQLAIGALVEEQVISGTNETGWVNTCTGTLVTDIHVLTAAHCLYTYSGELLAPEEIRFALGNNVVEPDGLFVVESFVINPQYNLWTGKTGHDHAVLTLRESPLEELEVQPLPWNRNSELDFLLGNYVQQCGYGSTESNYDNFSKLWTPELVVDFSQTQGEMRVYGQGISSVCNGDSGGPSLYSLGGNQLSIIGTVSWGDASCVDYDYYGLTHWDLEFLENNIPSWDYCGEITSDGTCIEGIAHWCENGFLQTDCCSEGSCLQNNDGQFRCEFPRDACPDSLDFKGECIEDTARWCWNGQVYFRDCSLCGQSCNTSRNEIVGNYCVD
ncbi:MAG: trypsin-like serine protease [Deltaproteobacteria bacterium]|jgi:V8-like Glu-specific endopeptidase|nr:trypsin-like serine protease [Deltaproteobacteria bacterium]